MHDIPLHVALSIAKSAHARLGAALRRADVVAICANSPEHLLPAACCLLPAACCLLAASQARMASTERLRLRRYRCSSN
jgi:hypothetical protein